MTLSIKATAEHLVAKDGEEMEDSVVLTWDFSPPDYFEEPIHIKCDDYQMTIENGKVEARISPSVYDSKPKMRQELHDSLNRRFQGVQLLMHTPYELSNTGVISRLHPDGCDITVCVPPAAALATGCAVDIVRKDKDGNTEYDSRKDRIERKCQLAELGSRSGEKDPLADFLLRAYGTAVRDPDNELAHLYVIREALSERFCGECAARAALRIKKAEWSRLGKLANDLPLKQGRHRGRSVGELRDATAEELQKARSIASDFVKRYLRYSLDPTRYENRCFGI